MRRPGCCSSRAERSRSTSPTTSPGLGRHGTYSYDDGKLTLHIASDEVTVDSTFELDLNADQPTFPFQAFSTEEGTSTWKRQVLGVMDGTDSVFQAARYDDAVPVPA